MRGVWGGFKAAVGLVAGLPLFLVLLPLWRIHVWSERRAGRGTPEPPWAVLRERLTLTTTGADGAGEAPVAVAWGCADGEKEVAVGEGREMTAAREGCRGVALVTGGGKRLGGVICRELALLGYRVGVGYHRDREAAERLAGEITGAGGSACAWPVDLRDPAGMEAFLDGVPGRLGGTLTVLVNSAALFAATPADGGSWEAMGEMMRVNLQGPMWLSLRAAVRMRAGGTGDGVIINIGDIWGERPLKGHATYSVSKAGLQMMTLTLARELGPEVRVNAIAPGAVLPPAGGGEREMAAYRTLVANTPLGGRDGPEGVASALRHLLGARFVTGEVLHVDGGRRLV